MFIFQYINYTECIHCGQGIMSEEKKTKELTTPEQEYDLLLESIRETGASFDLGH